MDELMEKIDFKKVYVNTPIDSKEKDFISVGTYADRLKIAIDENNAHMLGLIGPFGVGKSSVISLLEKEYENDTKPPQVYKVSMWSVLQRNHQNDGNNNIDVIDSVELHKSLVYQIASAINTDVGTYVSRRLNKSFSMISIRSRGFFEKVMLIIALVAFVLCFLIYNNYGVMGRLLINSKLVPICFLIALGVAILSIVIEGVLGPELIYTRDKRDSANNIEENEIIDLYRTAIIKRKHCKCCRPKKIIVVIEDLDRAKDKVCIVNFLKELRKYYTADEKNKYKNDIVFIVNIGPESTLLESKIDDKGKIRFVDSLYSKIFDFTLELPKVNIIDYEEILASLLFEGDNKEELKMLAKKRTWFQWLIRDTEKYETEKFGIRQLKERLNIALNLYDNLSKKAKDENDISFDKCAAFAFLITAYEKEFGETSDDTFENIINMIIKGEHIDEACTVALKDSQSDDFKKIIIELIQAKLIEDDYRIYFYNYPKGCKVNSLNEEIVKNAILYSRGTEEELNIAIENVKANNSTIIEDSLSKVKSLNVVPNDLIFGNTELLKNVVVNYFTLFEKKIENLKFDEFNKSKNIMLYLDAIKLGFELDTFTEDQIEKICVVLNEEDNESILLDFRKSFCANFPCKIVLFKSLFFEPHSIISKEEMQLVGLENVMKLMNMKSPTFDITALDCFIESFSSELCEAQSFISTDDFIMSCKDYLPLEEYVKSALSYMLVSEHINSNMEESFVSYVKSIGYKKGKNKDIDALFEKYQEVINKHIIRFPLSDNTMNNINEMDIERYDAFSLNVADKLYDKQDYINYVLIRIAKNESVDYADENICATIETFNDYLLDHEKWFLSIRSGVEKMNPEIIQHYKYLFDEGCPNLTEEEVEQILSTSNNNFDLLFTYLKPNLVTKEILDVILQNANSKKFRKMYTSTLFLFISKLPSALQKYAFETIDFSRVKFSMLNKQDKEAVHKAVESTFLLNTVLGRIGFMERTRHLFFDWQDDELISEVTTVNETAKAYIIAVNSSADREISPVVAKIVASLDKYYKASPLLQEALYKKGYYSKYIAGKILRDKKFVLESGKEGTKLWPYYVEVYNNADSELKSIMGSNVAFSKKYLESETLEIDAIKQTSSYYYPLCQTKEIIMKIFEDGNQEFIKGYFSKIGGFCDEDAARCFIDLLKASAVAKNQSIYDNAYGKLTNATLEETYDEIMGKSPATAN